MIKIFETLQPPFLFIYEPAMLQVGFSFWQFNILFEPLLNGPGFLVSLLLDDSSCSIGGVFQMEN